MQHCDPGRASVTRTSHADYEAHCARVGREHQSIPSLVQVRRKGETLCGRVVSCERFAVQHRGGEAEWFKVSIDCLGTAWVPASNVRLCAGVDGRCLCENLEAERQAGAQA